MRKEKGHSIFIKARQAPPTTASLKAKFEGPLESKLEGLKQLIVAVINDPSFPQMVIPVITHLTPVMGQSLALRKCMLLYWQVVDKYHPDGTPREEMLLACNGLRNDLLGHNQYMRGRTLRLLARMNIRSMVEPLYSGIVDNLQNAESYVRRGALVCLYYLYQTTCKDLFQDTDQMAEKVLLAEKDPSTKRNAFLLLFLSSQEKALKYIEKQIGNKEVFKLGEMMQLAIINKFRRVCSSHPQLRERLCKIIYEFVKDSSDSVTLECVDALTAISTSPSTIRLSLQTLCGLLINSAEINVKKAVLDRLGSSLYSSNRLEQCAADLLKVMSSPSEAIVAKAISILKQSITLKNSEAILSALVERVSRCSTTEVIDQTAGLLLQTYRLLPSLKTSVIQLLCRLVLPKQMGPVGIHFTKDLLFSYFSGSFERDRLAILVLMISDYQNREVIQAVLQVIGDKILPQEVMPCAEAIRRAVGPLPLSETEQFQAVAEKVRATRTVVQADGTYKTQFLGGSTIQQEQHGSRLRQNLKNDSKTGASLARTFAKLLLRIKESPQHYNREASSFILILCSVLRLYRSVQKLRDQLNIQTITFFLRMMLNPSQLTESAFFNYERPPQSEKQQQLVVKEVDDFLSFRQFQGGDQVLQVQEELSSSQQVEEIGYASRLNGLVQLTGYSDVVYVQAFVRIVKCEVHIDVLMINRRNRPLMNANFQFLSSADCKVLLKGAPQVLKPFAASETRHVLKFQDLNFGTIRGTFSYQNTRGIQVQYLHTAPIRLNILDYLCPAPISLHDFICKWQSYKEEKKLTFNTTPDKRESLALQIIRTVKAAQVSATPAGNPVYHVANLYGKSLTENDFCCCLASNLGDGGARLTLRLRSESRGLIDTIAQQLLKVIQP